MSGIKTYNGLLNNKWVLFEYESKLKRLTHNFDDGIVAEGENNLKLIVTDNAGNSTTFETKFLEVKKNKHTIWKQNLFIRNFSISFSTFIYAQSAKVTGIVLDEFNNFVDGVTVSYQGKSTISDNTGFYVINVPSNQKVVLIFTHISLKKSQLLFS